MNTSLTEPFFLEATGFSNCGQLLLGAARHLVGKEVPLHPLATPRSLIMMGVMKPYIDIHMYIQFSYQQRREQKRFQEEGHKMK